MKYIIKIFFFTILTGFILYDAKAEKTYASVTISGNSFNDASESWFGGGANIKVVSLSFFIGNQNVGTIYRQNLITPGSYRLTAMVDISQASPPIKIIVHYSHHEWNALGTTHYYPNLESTFDLATVTLGRYASETRTFNQFTGLDETISVDWRFNFYINITPFQSSINGSHNICYHDNDNINLTSNNLSFYDNSYARYQWQYGYYSKQWTSNPDFTTFEYNIIGSLYGLCPGGDVSCDKIEAAILNTDYTFMNDSYDLYSDLTEENKNQLASMLLYGILSQQHYYLSGPESTFLSANFRSVCLEQNSWASPYFPLDVISNWKDITINDMTGSIVFNPASLIPVSPGIVKVGIQVRASCSGIYGPFSDIKNITIKPKAPVFSFDDPVSCRERESGVVSLSGVSGVVRDFKALIRDINFGDIGEAEFFSGSDFTFSQKLLPGDYNIDVYYNLTGIDGCSVSQPLHVGQEKELTFDIFGTDATCPGKADGKIQVDIKQYADHNKDPFSCFINLGVTNCNNTTATFTQLDNQTYNINVSDFCTSETKLIVIAEKNAVNVSITSALDPACKSSPDGSLTAVASGSNNNYDFQLYESSNLIRTVSGTGSSLTFGTLPGGNYTVKSRSDLCTAFLTSDQKSLAPVPELDFASSVTDVNCFGASTGEIELTVTGGKPDYHYQFGSNPYSDNSEFKSLSAGTYQVTVHTSDMLCNDYKSKLITVNSSTKIQIGLDAVNASCFEKDDGSVKANLSGGSGAYSYSWQENIGGIWYLKPGSSDVQTGLYPGRYKVNVNDSYNCPMSAEGIISEPPLLVVGSAIPKDVVCHGENGSIIVAASGGSGGYEFSYHETAGQVFKSNVSHMELPAGNYYVSVKDAHGCESVFDDYANLKVTAPASLLDFTVSKQEYHGFNLKCTGDNSGAINIAAAGGNGSGYLGYHYSLSGAPDVTTGSFTGLSAGTYNMKVTDGRGCIVQKPLNLTEPTQLNLALVSTEPVKCFGASTGEIRVAATGGISGTYTYTLDGTELLSPGIFSNLYADTYVVEVADIHGCRRSLFATVQSPNPPIGIVMIPEDIRCFGENNGKINTIVSGGSGGFIYSWEINHGSGWQAFGSASKNMTDLVAAKYRIKATDSESCFNYRESGIREPSRVIVTSATPKDVVCFGEKGSFDIEAAGGNGGYAFYTSEDAGSTYNPYNPGDLLIPAVYRIKVMDSKGCEAIEPDAHAITDPGKPLDFRYELSQYGNSNISCHGNNDGSVSLFPSGGNDYGYSGYLFKLNGIDVNTGNLMNNMAAGNYEASLTDGRGCTITKTITLSEPVSTMNLKIASIEQPKCVYDKNGSISLFAEGGNQPYEYSVNGSLYGSSSVFTNLAVAQYLFKVRDANGCSEVIDASLVNLISEMKVSGRISDAKCYGENSGSVDVQVAEGATPYSFRWKDNSAVTSSRPSLRKGDYSVTITDAAGCITERSFTIGEPEHPLSISAVTSPACAELKNGIVKASAGGGTPPYLFAINRRSDYQSASQFEVFSGNHNVYVSDLNNCLSETSVVVSVKNVRPEINFMLATSRYELDTLVIIDVSVPVPDKVKWEFPEGTIVIDTTTHKAMIKYTESGLYPVKMTGKFGTCAYTIDKLLNISPFDPLISNEDRNRTGIKSLVVSPNPNDGRFIVNLELYTKQEVAVKIFDFYSRVLFSEKWSADISFRKEINLPENTLPGNYVLWIIGENDSRPLIVIISR